MKKKDEGIEEEILNNIRQYKPSVTKRIHQRRDKINDSYKE